MRGLSGDLTTMPLKDLVGYLGSRKVTGVLTLEHRSILKQAVLEDGAVVNASSNDPREYLGQFLINMGHITEEQFNRAYQTQRETKVYLGKILSMIGAVSEELVKTALSLKFRETLLEVFEWTAGEFRFEADASTERPEGLDFRIDLLDIQREAEFRETAWQAIRNAFPHGKVRLALVEAKLPKAPQGSMDERIFTLVRAGQTIDEMVLALHATDFFLYQRLYALYRQEALRVQEITDLHSEPTGTHAALVGDELAVADIVRHAREFLKQGSFEEAETLARRAYEMQATKDVTELLKSTETALLKSLRERLLERPHVPELLISPTKVKTLQLSAPERYLLSRVDGERDLLSIVNVAPLRELEALRFFQRFVDSGMVKLA